LRISWTSAKPGRIWFFGRGAGSDARYLSSDEFFQRVSQRSGVDLPPAVFQARVVVEVLGEAVSKSEIDDVRSQLPEDYQRTFESGRHSRMG
jgi:uncharacterized protein (DUF2267 family)